MMLNVIFVKYRSIPGKHVASICGQFYEFQNLAQEIYINGVICINLYKYKTPNHDNLNKSIVLIYTKQNSF